MGEEWEGNWQQASVVAGRQPLRSPVGPGILFSAEGHAPKLFTGA